MSAGGGLSRGGDWTLKMELSGSADLEKCKAFLRLFCHYSIVLWGVVQFLPASFKVRECEYVVPVSANLDFKLR
jgi:hypothetical protein